MDENEINVKKKEKRKQGEIWNMKIFSKSEERKRRNGNYPQR
jgi:hypothetical protein